MTSLCVHGLDVTLDLELGTAIHPAQLVGAEGRLDLPLPGPSRLQLELVGHRLVRLDRFAATDNTNNNKVLKKV